ncbi:MAG TPA: class I tRNA ligase family protein, partial [Terriglobales bacterium]|nr:class I tRNA ligase family protein [Terriglobales bacterium]
ESRTEGYRNFANKIWNAARFLFMNIDKASEEAVWSESGLKELIASEAPSMSPDLIDRWIEARFQDTAREVNKALEEYRFHEAANLVYQFFWGDLCDLYIEAVKLRLDFSGDRKDSGKQALNHLVKVFEGSLRLLSPFMPFITEEIWHALYDQKAPAASIALTRFPTGQQLTKEQKRTIEEVETLRELLSDIRNRRVELKVEQREKVPIRVFTADAAVRRLIESSAEFLRARGSISTIEFARESISKIPGVQTRNAYELAIVYERKIDVAAEYDRLSKEEKKLKSEHANAKRQLGNESFLAKAPANVVEGLRRRYAELEQLLAKTRAALRELENGGPTSNGSHG